MSEIDKLIDERSRLLSLLAKKLEVTPKDVSFLFGKDAPASEGFSIPDFKQSLSQDREALQDRDALEVQDNPDGA